MILILIFVVALVAWSLHLMQEAIERKEFSLMLAGFLVASAAAAMVAVYFLMGSYVGYMAQGRPCYTSQVSWEVPFELVENQALRTAQNNYLQSSSDSSLSIDF